MAYNTYNVQGYFTSDGTAQRLVMRGDIDWIHVWNLTALDAAGAGTGVEFIWMRDMAQGRGIMYQKTAVTNALNIDYMAAGTGFTLFDEGSDAILGALNATVTEIDNGAPPLVSLTDTTGLADGDVVKIINVPGAQQFGGIDFSITNLVPNTEFELAFAPAIAATGVVAGNIRRVNRDPLFYPRKRYISAITRANPTVITLTVAHDYNEGEIVRVLVPDAFDMTEMNNLTGEITAVSAANNTITVDIDSTAFTAFAWPLTTDVPFTPAQVVPLGDIPTVLEGATRNTGEIGVEFAAGADGPAGVLNDVIYWRAGKSFSIDEA